MNCDSATVPNALPSNRSVGLVFTSFFLLLAIFPLIHGDSVRFWSLVVSGLFGAISLAAPHWLSLLTKYWMGFADMLHKIVSPIFLGVLFFFSGYTCGVPDASQWKGSFEIKARAQGSNVLAGEETSWPRS